MAFRRKGMECLRPTTNHSIWPPRAGTGDGGRRCLTASLKNSPMERVGGETGFPHLPARGRMWAGTRPACARRPQHSHPPARGRMWAGCALPGSSVGSSRRCAAQPHGRRSPAPAGFAAPGPARSGARRGGVEVGPGFDSEPGGGLESRRERMWPGGCPGLQNLWAG